MPDRSGSLSSDAFERRTSTGSRRFALLSRYFEQIFGQIVSLRIKTLGNTNMVASRLINRKKDSLPVDVSRSKTSLLAPRSKSDKELKDYKVISLCRLCSRTTERRFKGKGKATFFTSITRDSNNN